MLPNRIFAVVFVGTVVALTGISLIATQDRSTAQSQISEPSKTFVGEQGQVLKTAKSGSATWTYTVPYAKNTVPVIECLAQADEGSASAVNCQLDGVPSNSSAAFKVIPSGVTSIHVTARAPS